MKKSILTIAVASAVALSACGPEKQTEEPATAEAPAPAQSSAVLDSNEQKLSYGLGQNIATQFQTAKLPVDAEAFFAGFSDQLDGKEPRLAEKEIAEAMKVVQEELVAERQKERDQMAAKNKTEGEAFLKENAGKEGVQVTESGLQYKVLTPAEGDKPGKNDRVKVHYSGTLIDGTEFDSSYKRGQPATFSVFQVIPGWTEGLQLMSPGSKYQFFIPSDLAYGPGGAGNHIGPNSTLIFEVELLEIVGPAEAQAPTAEQLEAAAAIKAAEEAAVNEDEAASEAAE